MSQWQPMMLSALLSAAVLSLASADSTKEASCKINLKTQIVAKDEPLILKEDRKEHFDFARPEVEDIGGEHHGVINVPADKKLMIACTGPKNTIAGSPKQTAYAECSEGQLKIDGEVVDEDTLSCSSGAAKSWLQKTTEGCGKGKNVGIKLELGFLLTNEEPGTFLPMVDVCHNSEQMVSYYATHSLYGKSLNGAVKSSQRKNFSPGRKELGLFRNVDPEYLYSQEGQKEALDIILGKGASSTYLSKTVFLARGHLAPDADFIYHAGQLMTYYYVNVAPQWQTFNAGNWLGIESAVRELAILENETLSVITGTYGIMKLKDLQGDEKEIYLRPSKESKENLIPVPEVYWKLVQHPVKKLCTVAIGHNNVFLTKPPTPICKTVKVNGWPELTSLNKGYVYYCDYDSFKGTVDYVPSVECKGTLELQKAEEKKKEKIPKKEKTEKQEVAKTQKPKREKLKKENSRKQKKED